MIFSVAIFCHFAKKILLQIPCYSEKDWARNAMFIKNLPKLPQLTTIWKGAQDFLLWYFEYCQIWQNKPSDDLHLSKHHGIGKKRTLVWMGQIQQKKPTPFPNSRIPISGSHKYHFSTHNKHFLCDHSILVSIKAHKTWIRGKTQTNSRIIIIASKDWKCY